MTMAMTVAMTIGGRNGSMRKEEGRRMETRGGRLLKTRAHHYWMVGRTKQKHFE